MHGFLAQPAVRAALRGRLVLSILAGVTLDWLRGHLEPETPIARIMTNAPARVGRGMSCVAPGPNCSAAQISWVEQMLRQIGRCCVVDEAHLDAVTALAGSGTAFALLALESLANGAISVGLPRAVAYEMAAQTLLGAGELALSDAAHPAALRDSVTTPGGCTIAGLMCMQEHAVPYALARTIEVTARRASELGNK